ncbi:MAG: mannose-1-phosphate guanylyltransferase/mannose-6-phosphate isomerase [Dongiaceae bacterium]
MRIVPVLLAGGAGRRLWPLSRGMHPKPVLALTSDRSLLQETALRVRDGALFGPPLVVCSDAQRFVVAEQLRRLGIAPAGILLEPAGRDTGPAVAVAALHIAAADPAALLLVTPVDHRVGDPDAFHDAVRAAVPAAAAGCLVCFGVRPTGPESGYGYIRGGAPLPGAGRALQVLGFVEKPPAAAARHLVGSGEWLWNSGIFLFPVAALIAELQRWAPAVLAAARAALAAGARDSDFVRLERAAFAAAPRLSIDRAVLESTDRAAVVPTDMDWTDVGAWTGLWQVGDKDAAGNVCIGDVVIEDLRGSYVRSDGPLTTVVGLDGVVVIATADAVLVAAKSRVQDIGGIVAGFRAERDADDRPAAQSLPPSRSPLRRAKEGRAAGREVTAPSPDQIRGPARRR